MSATYTSEDRVLVYVDLGDVRRGRNIHYFHITARRIMEIAALYGTVVMSVLFRDTNLEERVRAEWAHAGFLPVDKGPGTGRASVCILHHADAVQAHTVLIVASHGVEPAVLAELRRRGTRTVVLSPERNAPLMRAADAGILLEEVAVGKPLPRPIPGIDPGPDHGATSPFAQPTRYASAAQRLVLTDPESYALVSDILSVTDESLASLCERLRKLTEMEELPDIALAILMALDAYRKSDDAALHVNRLWHRLITYGVDVETVGRLSLALLAEEGTLLAMEQGLATDYQYARHPDDPSHRLARQYCQSDMLSLRYRRKFMRYQGRNFAATQSSYRDRVVQAAEIFMVNPAHLTPQAKADFADWIRFVMGSLTNGARMRGYEERGVPFPDAIALERQMRDILNLPDSTPDDAPDPEDAPTESGETPVGSHVRRTLPSVAPMPGLAKTSCRAG